MHKKVLHPGLLQNSTLWLDFPFWRENGRWVAGGHCCHDLALTQTS